MASNAADTPAQEALGGLVERVTFHNPENGFCVLRVKARGQKDLITVVGHAATIAAGEFVQLTGAWVNELRRTTGQELNKGESRNSLARAVFIHRLGEIRDRTYENQQHRTCGLNLLVTAIILWNTRYLERAVAVLRQTEDVPDHLLAHLSPLGWEHVNLTGDYVWAVRQHMTENNDGLRPLRAAPELTRKAA